MASPLLGAAWYLIVGWWATPLVVLGTWVAAVTVVGRPTARRLAGMVPVTVIMAEPWAFTEPADPDLAHPVVRAVYVLLVGWWASLLVAALATVAALTVVALPVAGGLLRRLFYVAHLRPVE